MRLDDPVRRLHRRRARAVAGAAAAAAAAVLGVAGAPSAAAEPCGTAGQPAVQVLERRAPDYPDGARAVGMEGYVDVELTVLRDGRAGWVKVRRAEPAGLFEQAALDAVRDWRFAPPEGAGGPVECTIATRVRFALSDEIMPGPPGNDGPGRPFPQFPEAARLAATEGHVRIEYAVGPDGRIANLAILEAVPRGAFEDVVQATLAEWRYGPGAGPAGRASREFRFRLPAYPRPDPVPQFTPASYPPELCTKRVRGRVTLDVELDAGGRVASARVVAADPTGVFDAVALRIVPQLRRTPARRSGVAVTAPARVTLEFEPERHCDAAGEPGRGPPGRRGPRVGATGR
jgi:TonB family protein